MWAVPRALNGPWLSARVLRPAVPAGWEGNTDATPCWASVLRLVSCQRPGPLLAGFLGIMAELTGLYSFY